MKSKKPLPGANSAENQPYLKVIHFGWLSSTQRLTIHLDPREAKEAVGFCWGRGRRSRTVAVLILGHLSFCRMNSQQDYSMAEKLPPKGESCLPPLSAPAGYLPLRAPSLSLANATASGSGGMCSGAGAPLLLAASFFPT